MRGQARTWGILLLVLSFGATVIGMPRLPCNTNRYSGAVGIDLGCKEAITLSTEQISKPEFIKEGQQKYEVHLKTPSQTHPTM